MTWKQRALASFMSDISERCYCAGWMSRLEYDLWRMVANCGESREYGMGMVTDEELADMRAIADEIGGWIIYHVDRQCSAKCGKQFVPMAEWLEMVEKRSTHASK